MTESEQARVLLVEDNPSTALIYENYLAGHYEVIVAATASEALDLFEQADYEVCVIDIGLPDMSGIALMNQLQRRRPQIPVIIATSSERASDVVDAINAGANDYLTKPVDRTRLNVTVANCLKQYQVNRLVTAYDAGAEAVHFNGMVGESAVMQKLFAAILPAAKSNAPVFITGESGTGKELCAEAIHRESARGLNPFVAINCAAIPRELIESEIFGHVKGAFTGAIGDRKGAALRANGGTLFLDEIGELPVDLQSKILRFVQTHEITPVGSNHTVRVDVRFVCATNRDPQPEIERGTFREDLFYRLNVIPMHMPALRERGSDISRLAHHFLQLFSKKEGSSFIRISSAAELVLRNYHWPGNVRQLENVIRQIVIMNQGDEVTPTMLPLSLVKNYNADAVAVDADERLTKSDIPAVQEEPVKPLWKVEKEAITNALEQSSNSVTEAAKKLQVNPSTIYRKMARWNSSGRG
ncbi:sigma-54 dependent transcriptional regulator [Idiomarina seosinensis]|uniref:sigma-54-dependent transcriptional regulator n=1 Tax=Idiomarina seosinensis TaxID=281739 RepID=UPI00384BA472